MRLIDADKLLKDNRLDNLSLKHQYDTMALYEVADMIEWTDTVDAEPIVRCKDCEWWTKQKSSIQGRCAKLEIYPTGAWFCANGEKRGADNA